MKKDNWFFVSFAILIFTASGCASAPKVKTVPVYSTPAPTNALPQSPYRFSQDPAKRVIEDDGREYRAHIRELQRQRFAHERQLARIEQAAEEAALAKELGVTLAPAQAAGQPQSAPQATSYPTPSASGSAIYPTGYPYPGTGGSAIYPTGYPYPGAAGSAIYPTGYPFPGGDGTAIYPGSGCGNGFGSVPITQGTFRSTVRVDCGRVRSGVLGKVFNWLTKSEDFPGLRHTGGPAVVERDFAAGGEVVVVKGLTSGLSFGWRR